MIAERTRHPVTELYKTPGSQALARGDYQEISGKPTPAVRATTFR
jgi:hypothetical protein